MGEIAGTGKKQLYEHALRELRARILSGELAPEAPLSESGAAELLGISRTPMREAMAQLVEEGLLERSASGRCTVRQLTREDIIDALEFRGVLEGTVVRIAAERGADPRALAACERIADAIDAVLETGEARLDFDRYTELNGAFHENLARLSRSATLERELQRAQRLPLASPNAFLQRHADSPLVRRSLYRAQAQHRGILEAVRDREGSRAEALAREHARLARKNLDQVIFTGRNLVKRIPGLARAAAMARPAPSAHRSHHGRTA